MKTGLILTGGCLTFIGLIFISPLISALGFLVGAFTGWLIANVFPWFGQWIINGMALLGLHLQMADLPLLVAILGFIGGYFKSHNYGNSK